MIVKGNSKKGRLLKGLKKKLELEVELMQINNI